MKTNAIIRADVFIVPNGLRCYSATNDNNVSFWNKQEEVLLANKSSLTSTKLEDNKLVEVWYVTPGDGDEDSNWFDHAIDGYEELCGYRPISRFLPIELFESKTEGQTVTVELPIERFNRKMKTTEITTVKVALILSQRKYRYSRYGTFEETLSRLI